MESPQSLTKISGIYQDQRINYQDQSSQSSISQQDEYIQDLLQQIKPKKADEFQNQLQENQLKKIWEVFRQTGNSYEGKIVRKTFMEVFTKQIGIQDSNLLKLIFERFKLDKFQINKEEILSNIQKNIKEKDKEIIQQLEQKLIEKDNQKIDLQDLLISLTILSKLDIDTKLKLIFKWVDEDEDGCLSFEQMMLMFIRIEKNFAKENLQGQIKSKILINQIAFNKAMRNFQWAITNSSKVNNINQSNAALNTADNEQEEGLITFEDYSDILRQKPQLKQKLLPNTFKIMTVLQNIYNHEQSFAISESQKDYFEDFRKEFHLRLQGQQESLDFSKKQLLSKDDQYDSSCFYLEKDKGILNTNSLNYVKLINSKGAIRLPGKVGGKKNYGSKTISNTFVFNQINRFRPQSIAYEKNRLQEKAKKEKEEDEQNLFQPFNQQSVGTKGMFDKNKQDTNTLEKHIERLKQMEDKSTDKKFELHKDLYKTYKDQMLQKAKQNKIQDKIQLKYVIKA